VFIGYVEVKMDVQNKPVGRKPGTFGRRAVKAIAAILIVIALIGGSGWLYQAVSESKDVRQYSPLGQMVDVGGYRLHLYCTGQGNPTVVLESGLASPALQWALVQQKLAKTTRVCSYDRAGVGWSDNGPSPRTTGQMVAELHTLLQRSGIAGPYVLVGHSLGGFNVRLFAHEYPDETAALVLVASGNENDNARMPPQYDRIEQSNLQTDRMLALAARFGLTRLAGKMGLLASFTGLLARFPPDLQAEMTALTFYRSQYWATAYAELSAMDADRAQMAGTGSLGDLPLVVLSGSPDVSRLPASFPVEQIKQTFQELQDELAGLSSNSTHIVCDTCDHYIPMTNPDLVVQAIQQALDKAKK
jgi:pimeloyl-ACP methyl ester carboxylesterase